MASMRRRTFLFQAGAAVSAARAAAKVRIAFLGGSHSHAFEKARVVLSLPDYELAGVSEERPEIASKYRDAGIPILTRQQVLSDRSIPVVAVESAVPDHARDARQALEAGKHIHLEKPPAATMAEFRSIAEITRRNRLLLQSGYMWRYHPGFNRALEAARQGWLGQVYLVRGVMNTLVEAQRRPEWALFKGGQMFEQGAHLVDAIVRLLGRPAKVTPFLRTDGEYKDTLKDNTLAVLEYPKAMALVQSATLQPDAFPHRSFEILGTDGTAVLRPIEPPRLELDLASAAGPYRNGRQTVELPEYRRYVGDFVELAAAVRGEKPLSVSLDEELLVQETLLKASEMS